MTTYPSLRQHGVPLSAPMEQWNKYNGTSDIIAAMENGTCEYSVAPSMLMDAIWSSAEACDLKFIGEPVSSTPVGYYVTEELRPLISWAVASRRTHGKWIEVERDFGVVYACDHTNRRLAVQSEISRQNGVNFARRVLSSGSSRNIPAASGGPGPLAANHMYGACLLVLLSFV